MGKGKTVTGLPDALNRRVLLQGRSGERLEPAALAALGDRYLAAGWISDALDCYEAAGAAGVEKVRALKARVGASAEDFWIFQRIARIAGVGATADEWKAVAEKALASGKLEQAASGFERAGDAEAAARVKEQIAAFRGEVKPPTHGRRGLPLT